MTGSLKSRLFLLLRVVVAAVVVAAFIAFVRHLDWRELWRAVGRASLAAILGAIAINFFHMWVKALRWQVMLAPTARVSVWRLFRYTVANYATSTLLPARLGELVRVRLLKQREGISKTTTAGIAVVEKVLEGLAMLIFVAPVPWLLPSLPKWISTSILMRPDAKPIWRSSAAKSCAPFCLCITAARWATWRASLLCHGILGSR